MKQHIALATTFKFRQRLFIPLILAALYLLTWLLISRQKSNDLSTGSATSAGSAPFSLSPFITDQKPVLLPTGATADWWLQAQADISKELNNIHFSKERQVWQSMSGSQNLLFSYHQKGFTVQSDIPVAQQRSQNENEIIGNSKTGWKAEFTLDNIETSDGKYSFKGKDIKAAGSHAFIEDDRVKIEYENGENGMRQNFVIKQAPAVQSGDDKIVVNCRVETSLQVMVDKNILQLRSGDGVEQMQYKDLKVWDADGKDLVAKIVSRGEKGFAIEVEAAGAQYPVTIDPLSVTPNWSTSIGVGSRFGWSVASAGDVNHDGYGDVIIGAFFCYSQYGAAFVFYGSPGGLSSSWSTVGDYFDYTGYCVASAGDVNGDNFDDVIIGVIGYPHNAYLGRVIVFYGSAAGLGATPDWSIDGTIANPTDRTYLGNSVAPAGDINKDGYDDVIIGAPQWGFTNMGRALVYYGSATGLSPTPAWSVPGTQVAEEFGGGVSSAGDVNGDGYVDVIVGSTTYSNGSFTSAGRVNVYYNGPSGLSTTPNWTVAGTQTGMRVGEYVASAGDVNHDGYSDVMVSSPYYSNGQTSRGIVSVYYGSSTGLSPSPNWEIQGSQVDMFLGDAASPAGDINNDGYSDIILGASGYDGASTDQGQLLIYCGSAAGLSSTPNWHAEGAGVNTHLGMSAAAAGDVNGDGFADIVAGAIYGSNNTAFVYQAPQITLPLKLLSFEYVCRGNDINLSWRTSEEQNTKEFIVERSNGNSWQDAGVVHAAGMSNNPIDYHYAVPLQAATTNYRLKMVDIDGRFSYSQVIAVRNSCSEKAFNWSVAPNPVHSSGTFQLSLFNQVFGREPLTVKLTDMQGHSHVLAKLSVSLAAVVYSANVSLPVLSPGTYIITISNNDLNESKRILVIP